MGETLAMRDLPRPRVPLVVSIGCRATAARERYTWHSHPFDELCLIAEAGTMVGHAGRQMRVEENTLILFRRGEEHGFWNGPQDRPRLWVAHYSVDDAFYQEVLPLDQLDPQERVWRLAGAQLEAFRSLFLKVSLEASLVMPDARGAESAWLQLLLAATLRWRSPHASPALEARMADPELVMLWRVLNDHVGVPFAEMDRLPDLIENYDSLRHRFRRVMGASPRALLLRMKMQLAQNLLIEGDRSVKEVAHEVGYWRVNEFTRAFRRVVGMTPTEWRQRPSQ